MSEGTPFRDAYEQTAKAVRAAELGPPHDAGDSVAARAAPGLGDVGQVLASSRARFESI